MSERGVFAVHRGVFSHPILAGEAYTRVQAWVWLLANAAWKPTRIRIGRHAIALDRGQLAFSERFLATKWIWSKSKVHRFLTRLQTEAMVSLKADHETNLITICNYDEYQFGGTADEPLSGPHFGPEADQSRTKEEEGNKERIDIVRSAPASEELFGLPTEPKRRRGEDPLFAEFYAAYPRRQSKQDAIKAYAQVIKSGVAHEAIMRGLERAKRGDRRFREAQFTPLPASWLRAGGFDDEPNSNEQSAERLAFA